MMEKKTRKISIGFRNASESPALMMERRLKGNKPSVFEDEAAKGLPDITDSQNGAIIPLQARHASEAPIVDRSLEMGSRKVKRDR